MDKAPWLLFWASIAIMLFGIVDRLLTVAPIIEGVAPGTYWKAGIALIAYSVALTQLRSARSGA